MYVHHARRGHGIGRRLLNELIELARGQGYHVLVGGIDAENASSITLHEKLGFTPAQPADG
jgi:phosphinothricin acetyltransferase